MEIDTDRLDAIFPGDIQEFATTAANIDDTRVANKKRRVPPETLPYCRFGASKDILERHIGGTRIVQSPGIVVAQRGRAIASGDQKGIWIRFVGGRAQLIVDSGNVSGPPGLPH